MLFFLQAALEKDKSSTQVVAGGTEKEELVRIENAHDTDSVKPLISQMNELAVSSSPALVTPVDLTEDSNPGVPVQDIDKRIRALKKKVLNQSLTFPFYLCSTFHFIADCFGSS